MCGLAGGIGVKPGLVEQMLERIAHRGPDGRGIVESGPVVHGHVRLALVDLTSASAQPFRRGGSVLSFNGEVWNFCELRADLEAAGDAFSTTGDTEVLAAWLSRFGLARLAEIDGMFAFAFSDAVGGHWLVRDSFGKVPLYVARVAGGYLWASERKAFPPRIKPIAVPPGHVFDLTTGRFSAWYRAPAGQATTASDVLALLRRGVIKRLSADAPVCCLISGGLDSSLVLALAVKERPDVVAFTAVFDERSSDLASARRLCKQFGVRLIEVPVAVDTDAVARAIRSIEIPSKAQIEIAVLCIPLAQRIYAEGFRACLSGEAADELFGGYGNFCIKASKLRDDQIPALRREQLAKMARGNFVRCNKAFMAAGVECRLPFMEQELVERAVTLGKVASPTGKKLLKEAARGLLPAWIINRVKDTFQGASGVSEALAGMIASPTIFYNAELRSTFGYLPKD